MLYILEKDNELFNVEARDEFDAINILHDYLVWLHGRMPAYIAEDVTDNVPYDPNRVNLSIESEMVVPSYCVRTETAFFSDLLEDELQEWIREHEGQWYCVGKMMNWRTSRK